MENTLTLRFCRKALVWFVHVCVWTDRSVWVQGIHLLLAAPCLTEEHWHWWEQTGWRQRPSSQMPHRYGCNPFDHPFFSASLSLSFCRFVRLCLRCLFSQKSKSRRAVAVMAHDTHPFVFWVFPSHWPLRHIPPSIHPSLPTHSHASMHTPTHSLLPLIPRSQTRQTMEELLLRHSVKLQW